MQQNTNRDKQFDQSYAKKSSVELTFKQRTSYFAF